MRSTRWRSPAGLAAVAMAALAVAAAACGCSSGGGSAGSGSSSSAAASPATGSSSTALKTANIGGGTALTNAKGFTLYWFVPDTATKSNCNGSCAGFWPPVTGPVATGCCTVAIGRRAGATGWTVAGLAAGCLAVDVEGHHFGPRKATQKPESVEPGARTRVESPRTGGQAPLHPFQELLDSAGAGHGLHLYIRN